MIDKIVRSITAILTSEEIKQLAERLLEGVNE